MRKTVKIFRSFLSCVLLTGVFMMPAAKAGPASAADAARI